LSQNALLEKVQQKRTFRKSAAKPHPNPQPILYQLKIKMIPE